MKMLLAYFSGTGNTEYVAHLFQSAFQQQQCEVMLCPIDKWLQQPTPMPLQEFDQIGLFYPIHAFDAPKIVYQWIQVVQSFDHIPVFVIKSPGSPFAKGGSVAGMRKTLQQHQANVFYEDFVVMPANSFTQYDDALSWQIIKTAEERTAVCVQEILQGKHRHETSSWLADLGTRISAWLESRLGAYWFGRGLQANENCTACGICARICPVGNIRMDHGKPRFGGKCLFCLRCVYGCPQHAIKNRFMQKVIFPNGYSLPQLLKLQESTLDKKKVPREMQTYFAETKTRVRQLNL